MGKNILWQNLSPAQIRKMIREWPVAETKSEIVAKAAQKAKLPVVDVKVPKVKVKELKGLPTVQRQKHFGADGEVKFVPHRELYLGFFGGRPAVKARTEDACKALLKKRFGIEAPKTQG